ncbi:MAG: TonB family protein [Candidatus Sulfotelmatobacter sp.]
MSELKPKTALAKARTGLATRERSRLLIALALLVVALAVVIVRDRDFWFGSDDETEADGTYTENVPKVQAAVAPAKTAEVTVAPAVPKNRPATKPSTAAVIAPPSKEATNPKSPAVETKRAVLPPLDVEVIAGDTHSTIHPGSNIAKVEIPGASNRAPAFAASVVGQPTNAADRERISSTDLTYPLLGQHARVQGSVVLQAVVGTDGTIQNLRVLSGPAILTAAAQQAVRQWRFKPYLQNGQPVETKATITVNFSIRVSDNPAKAI